MKKLISILFIALSFSACKKGDDVKPQTASATIAGVYTLSELRYQDANGTKIVPQLPVVEKGKTTYSGTVTITESANANQAAFVLDLLFAGQQNNLDLGEVDIQSSGTSYTLLSDGDKVATISGNKLSFDVSTNDFRLAFTAKK